MYGLPQAGIISHTQLKRHIFSFGYKLCQCTPGLWDNKTRDTRLCLVVDNFGIKYTISNNLQRILSDMQKNLQYRWI